MGMKSADEELNAMIAYRYAELAAVVLRQAVVDATQARSSYRREEARIWLSCGIGREWLELLGGEVFLRHVLAQTQSDQRTLFEFDFGG